MNTILLHEVQTPMGKFRITGDAVAGRLKRITVWKYSVARDEWFIRTGCHELKEAFDTIDREVFPEFA